MIEWIDRPKFELKDESPYNKVVCSKSGGVCLNGMIINFPVGWETDITTTPRILFWLLPQLGSHNPTAILHDRLLDLKYPRKVARFWMKEQLIALEDVTKLRRNIMWLGVWLKNTSLNIWNYSRNT